MKIDPVYLKGLLQAFQAAERPWTDINLLKVQGFDKGADRFLFHLQILEDQRLVVPLGGSGLGYVFSRQMNISWTVKPMRLSSAGHDFLQALETEPVWEAMKSQFKDATAGTLVRVGKQLLEGYAKQKITKLLDEGL